VKSMRAAQSVSVATPGRLCCTSLKMQVPERISVTPSMNATGLAVHVEPTLISRIGTPARLRLRRRDQVTPLGLGDPRELAPAWTPVGVADVGEKADAVNAGDPVAHEVRDVLRNSHRNGFRGFIAEAPGRPVIRDDEELQARYFHKFKNDVEDVPRQMTKVDDVGVRLDVFELPIAVGK
jgi:hypothetical protein